MKHCYITKTDAENGFIEVSEDDFNAFLGDEDTKPYAGKLYRNEITIEDVPEELREKVQAVVSKRIELLGNYQDAEITSNDFLNMVSEVL